MGYKVKKRKKFRRFRGSRGCGGGFRQKRRGKGNTGGIGMAGTGKRASQKVQFGQIKAREAGFEKYFGKSGFTSASTERKKKDELNLDDIQKVYEGKNKIELKGYKILGRGDGFKAEIHAKSASKSAKEKMQKAGGKLILENDKIPTKEEVEQVLKEKKPAVKAVKKEEKK